ncbi:MAG TPA: HAD hydrolase family protein, partial [Myxococcota bacterium]|nr:HAD hydrolase family protein [Myxococcota bacterium]
LELEAEAVAWPPSAPLVRMQWNLPTPRWEALKEAAEPIAARLSAHEGRSPRMPGVSFVSLTAAGVSKATGVRTVLEAYGLTPDQAAMAGDNHNDLEALRLVARRFVPSDGAAEARALADVLIAPPEAGGVGEAARQLTLAGSASPPRQLRLATR